MTILEKIKNDSIEARKLRDAVRASLLVTLLSEAQAVGKNAQPPRETSDEEVIQVIKKFIKNAEQICKDALNSIQLNKMDIIQKSSEEIKILKEYLPTQLSESAISEIVNDLKKSGNGMKEIMTFFKETHSGRYDASLVAKLAKN